MSVAVASSGALHRASAPRGPAAWFGTANAQLQVDMMNLKKDPRLREKLKLDDPDKPQPSLTGLWYDWINNKLKRKEDY